MDLYMKSGKQFFIAFDKQKSPTEGIQEILDKTTILQLSDGYECFGKSWGRMTSEVNKDEE